MGEEPHQLWCIPAKVKGRTGPSAVQMVRATSALQAEAIVRRMGLEVQEGSAVVTTEHGSESKFQNPVPLICDLCGYELSGLVVHAGVLDCPECSHTQFIFNHGQYVDPKCFNSGYAKFFIGAFAAIGGLAVSYFIILFILFLSHYA